MNFDKVVSNFTSSVDVGTVLKRELEESISPITDRVDRLEKKIDLLILTMQRIEDLLTKIQPLVKLLQKFKFLS
jgi:prefoldin subunit 5